MPKKKERSSAPKLGAAYWGGKVGAQVAAGPVWSAAVTPADRGGAALGRLKSRNYQKGVFMALAEGFAAKKLRLANAVSRKSVTAIAPEVLAGLEGARAANLDPIGSLQATNANMTGYNFTDDGFDVNQAKGYVAQHAAGYVIRKVGTHTNLLDPVKKFLSMMGVTL